MAAKIAEIAATADDYPGVVIVEYLRPPGVAFMSAWGLTWLGTTLAEMQALGPAYQAAYFVLPEAQDYLKEVMAFLTRNQPDEVLTGFQQIMLRADHSLVWFMSAVRVLLRSPADSSPLLLLTVACPLNRTGAHATRLDRLTLDDEFQRAHRAAYFSLSAREREVLRHLALGETTPQICAALNISRPTVSTHRRNLRRKLGASNTQELARYARAFGLL